MHSVTHWTSSLLGYGLLLSEGYIRVTPCSPHSCLLDQPVRVNLELTGLRGTSVRDLKEPLVSWTAAVEGRGLSPGWLR